MVAVSATGLSLALARIVDSWNLFLLGSVFLAGFVTALSVAARRFWLALAQVGPTLLVVFVLFAIGFKYDSRWENVGLDSVAVRTLFFAPLAALLCAAGGGVGWLLTRGATPNKSLERTREG
jgi:hypothetical protein